MYVYIYIYVYIDFWSGKQTKHMNEYLYKGIETKNNNCKNNIYIYIYISSQVKSNP